MRIPFFSPKEPEDLKGIASRVTYIPSHTAAGPRLQSTRTLEDNRAAAKRIRRILNGGQPPS
jgi:hypothetical protein